MRDLIVVHYISWHSFGGNPRCKSFWDGMISKVSRRLDRWKWGLFSMGGRVTLIQACLSTMPIYYIFLFKIPAGIIRELEGVIRNFYGLGMGRPGEIN